MSKEETGIRERTDEYRERERWRENRVNKGEWKRETWWDGREMRSDRRIGRG